MTTFDPNAAGNKGIPTPKEGYEQRRVSYRKYNDAYGKGWRIRNDDGNEYHGGDAILCERLIVNVVPKEVLDHPLYNIDVEPEEKKSNGKKSKSN